MLIRSNPGSGLLELPPMDFRDRQVVITGGTGALGTAVVEALIGAGAI